MRAFLLSQILKEVASLDKNMKYISTISMSSYAKGVAGELDFGNKNTEVCVTKIPQNFIYLFIYLFFLFTINV